MTTMSPGVSAALKTATPQLWINPTLGLTESNSTGVAAPEEPTPTDIAAAQARFDRAQTLLPQLFPCIRRTEGQVESPLLPVPRLHAMLGLPSERAGMVFVKADHLLPVAGAITARGGFHAVLAHAEAIAVSKGLIGTDANLIALAEASARAHFARRTIVIDGVGNVGLGIGILSATLGFVTVVHMPKETTSWKKILLQRHSVHVVERGEVDHQAAIGMAKVASEADPFSYFVDNQTSRELFLGYATAAHELVRQLHEKGRAVSTARPLFVYLPCGVGSAPGSITYALKQLLGANVHCFFAESVVSPCMIAQLASGIERSVSIDHYGTRNSTGYIGSAVQQPSLHVANLMNVRLSGIFTVTDEQLFTGMVHAWQLERMIVEPASTAGFLGPRWLLDSDAGRRYIATHGLESHLADATHILWSTGSGRLPNIEHRRLRRLAQQHLVAT